MGEFASVVLPKTRRDCRRVFRAIRERLESRATFLNSMMHPRILAVFRVSFSTSFSVSPTRMRSSQRYLIELLFLSSIGETLVSTSSRNIGYEK